MASGQREVYEIVEGMIDDNDGAVHAHLVREALAEFGCGYEDVEDLRRIVEMLGFRLADGFVMMPSRVDIHAMRAA